LWRNASSVEPYVPTSPCLGPPACSRSFPRRAFLSWPGCTPRNPEASRASPRPIHRTRPRPLFESNGEREAGARGRSVWARRKGLLHVWKGGPASQGRKSGPPVGADSEAAGLTEREFRVAALQQARQAIPIECPGRNAGTRSKWFFEACVPRSPWRIRRGPWPLLPPRWAHHDLGGYEVRGLTRAAGTPIDGGTRGLFAHSMAPVDDARYRFACDCFGAERVASGPGAGPASLLRWVGSMARVSAPRASSAGEQTPTS